MSTSCITDLPHTPYAESDPNVRAYGLRTYLGHVVRCEGAPVGSLCVVYQTDYQPTDDDRRVLGILASAIGSEDKRQQEQKALRETERRQRGILDTIPDPAWLKDKAGRYLAVNRAWCEFLGKLEAQALGRTEWEVSPPELVAKYAEEDQTVIRTGKPLRVEECYPHPSRGGVWFEIFKAPLFDAQGGIAGITGIARDITERKRAERELLENQNRLNRAQQVAHVGDWEWDIATNQVHWSDEIYRIYGYEPHAIAPDYGIVVKAMHPKSRDEFLAAIDAALKGERPFELDYTFFRPDGSVAILHTIGQVSRDHNGTPVRMTGIVQDITERKHADQALRESEERLKFVLEGSQLGLWDWNLQTGVVQRNDRWAGMLGYALAEIAPSAEQSQELVHPDEREAAWESIQNHLQGRTPLHEIEHRMRTRDGHYKWILDRARIVQRGPDGRPLRMSGTHTDITERKRAEEALRKSEASLAAAQRLAHLGSWEEELRDLDHRENNLLRWSEETYRIFGHEPYAVPATPELAAQAVNPDDGARLQSTVRQALRERQPYDVEYRIVRPDGRQRVLHEHAELVFDGSTGCPVKLLGTVQDVTDRKALEA